MILGLLAAIFWAASLLLIAGVSRTTGSDAPIFWGLLAGGAVPAVAALVAEPFRADVSDLVRLGVAGLSLIVAWWSFTLGIRSGPVSGVGAISAVDGAIAAGVAIALGERPSVGVVLALALVVAGVLTVSASGGSSVLGRMPPIAVFWALMSALGYASFLVSTGGLDVIGPLWATALARGSALVMVGPVLLARRRLLVGRRGVALCLGSGAVTSLGVICFLVASRDGIAIPSVMASSYAAWTALGAVLVLREKVHRGQLVGVVVIMSGMAGLAVARS